MIVLKNENDYPIVTFCDFKIEHSSNKVIYLISCMVRISKDNFNANKEIIFKMEDFNSLKNSLFSLKNYEITNFEIYSIDFDLHLAFDSLSDEYLKVRIELSYMENDFLRSVIFSEFKMKRYYSDLIISSCEQEIQFLKYS